MALVEAVLEEGLRVKISEFLKNYASGMTKDLSESDAIDLFSRELSKIISVEVGKFVRSGTAGQIPIT